MRNIRLILLTCGMICLFGIHNLHAQEGKNSETVIIRMVEFFTIYSGKMTVLHPDGTSHSLEINTLKMKEFSADNAKVLQEEIDRWKKAGFKIDGVSIGSGGDNALFTVVIMSKE